MELTVLGSSGTYPGPDAACSGYLVTAGDAAVWTDCGSGSFSNLQRHTDHRRLSAVVITHLHADHIIDFFAFYFALRYGKDSLGPAGLKVYAPAGAEELLLGLLSVEGPASFDGYFSFEDIADGAGAQIRPLTLTFGRTLHPPATFAVRYTHGETSMVYTSDTGLSDGMVEFAKGADLLVAEASMIEPVERLAEVHMTAEQAGRMAERAAVDALMLTHMPPGLDREEAAAVAARHFSGRVLIASDNLRHTLGI